MTGTRRIAVVSTSRADYTIYRPLLHRLSAEPEAELQLVAGGSHLLAAHGSTFQAIESDGFAIADRVEHLLASDSPEATALSMALGMEGFARAFARLRPDLIVVLGDRFEMHAAVAAASPFEIGIAHLYGGELTLGAIDDAWRHSITKLSHLHFVATDAYARRVAQLGEEDWRIHIVGALSLDNLDMVEPLSVPELESMLELDLSIPPILVTLHPETRGTRAPLEGLPLLEVLAGFSRPIVISAPNADPGNLVMRRALSAFAADHPNVRFLDSVGTAGYFGLMRCAAAMIGNSSSGIIEAPSFGLPVVNVGHRQDGRIRGANVIDCENTCEAIETALHRALDPSFKSIAASSPNPYRSDGPAAPKIVKALLETSLGTDLLAKRFVDLPR